MASLKVMEKAEQKWPQQQEPWNLGLDINEALMRNETTERILSIMEFATVPLPVTREDLIKIEEPETSVQWKTMNAFKAIWRPFTFGMVMGYGQRDKGKKNYSFAAWL